MAIEVEHSEKILAVDCIKIHEEHLRAGKDKAIVAEHSAFRAVVGSLHYIAARTRPDLAVSASILQGAAKSPQVKSKETCRHQGYFPSNSIDRVAIHSLQ